MDKWIVEPLVRVNNIHFGMDRNEVRKILNLNYTEFKKSKFSKNTTDDYGLFHIFYDIDNKCEAVEIFDSITVSIDGNDIFPIELSLIDNIAIDFEQENDSFINKDKSIGIYAPYGKMESILFGAKDYYL